MRLGCPLLFALVLLAFPTAAAAETARLVTVDVQSEALSIEVEHTLLSQAAADGQRKRPAGSELGRAAIAIAIRYLGTPYRWAGSSPSGFDCSGFVMYVYGRVGIKLPHNSAMQYGFGRAVPRSRLEPGDLVFFNGLTHVGIYVGHGRFIHSPHSGDVVRFSRLSESWYRSTYYGARRLHSRGKV